MKTKKFYKVDVLAPALGLTGLGRLYTLHEFISKDFKYVTGKKVSRYRVETKSKIIRIEDGEEVPFSIPISNVFTVPKGCAGTYNICQSIMLTKNPYRDIIKDLEK